MLNGDDPLGDPITSNLDLAYKEIFLYAHIKGKFIAGDFDLNSVIMDDNSNVPEFVQKHEDMLGQKRKVPDDVSYFCIYCLRLLTAEASCVRLRRTWVKRFSRNILIVRQRIPLSPLPLLTDSRLTTPSPFHPLVQSCGIPRMMETENSSKNAMRTGSFSTQSRVILNRSLPTLQVMEQQKSPLNCESRCICNVR
jgi:hypothetical protein